jgi:hypothetical protein
MASASPRGFSPRVVKRVMFPAEQDLQRGADRSDETA